MSNAKPVSLVCAVALLLGGCALPGSSSFGGFSFSDTLPKMIDDFGENARVISVLDSDGDVSFSVLVRGKVHERLYENYCTPSNVNSGTSCSHRVTNRVHRAVPREREAARVTLGELDGGVVGHLRDATGAYDGAPVGLRGRRWVVAAAVFKSYIADFDGGHVHAAKSSADRAFANSVSAGAGARRPGDRGGSATGPPPDLPAPPGEYAQGRPDFDAFAQALRALRARLGRGARISLALVDTGVVSFEYGAVKLRWDPAQSALVRDGQPFSGHDPSFPLALLSAARAERMARVAATRVHAEVAPGVLFTVVGGRPMGIMTVDGPSGPSNWTASPDGRGLHRVP
jgi:hypothetical protein